MSTSDIPCIYCLGFEEDSPAFLCSSNSGCISARDAKHVAIACICDRLIVPTSTHQLFVRVRSVGKGSDCWLDAKCRYDTPGLKMYKALTCTGRTDRTYCYSKVFNATGRNGSDPEGWWKIFLKYCSDNRPPSTKCPYSDILCLLESA